MSTRTEEDRRNTDELIRRRLAHQRQSWIDEQTSQDEEDEKEILEQYGVRVK